MHLALRARRGVCFLIMGLTLGTACGSSDSEDAPESASDNASTAAGGDDDGEPGLDPNRNYGAAKPSGKQDAGAARSTGAAPIVAPGSTASSVPSTVVTVPPSVAVPPAQTVAVNPFVEAGKDPFSTFGADVDTASYDYLRQSVSSYHALPEPELVRVEDYVNFFKYSYPVPAADAAQPFAISLAASKHPLGRSTTLLRVGIQAKAAPARTQQGANLIFLVDTSGSMSSPDKLPLVKRVLTESLRVLAPTDKISVVTYAGDTRVRLAPTPVSSAASIESVIGALDTSGGTNGASGINLAYEQASAAFIPGGINHVILCTDGDFNIGASSDEALVQLIKDKRATGVTLTALGFGHGNLNDSMMEAVSNAGNGSYSIVFSEDQAVKYANERLLSTIVHVAKDMKIQVEFNPAAVTAYRLLGYEDRDIADVSFRDDKVDGGEVGAEHRVTALYELVLAGGPLPSGPGIPGLSVGEASDVAREVLATELVRVKVRSKPVTATDADPASEVVSSLTPAQVALEADPDLAWAAALASFAEILRESPYVAAGELDAVERITRAQRERDGDRAEFVSLLASARLLLAE